MKIIIIFLIFFSLPTSWAYLKPLPVSNKDYMSYVLNDYIPWVKTTFKIDFESAGKIEKLIIQESIKKIDNWLGIDSVFFPEFMLGLHDRGNTTEASFQIYIHPSIRKDHIINKLGLKDDPLFISWSKDEGVCFITKLDHQKVDWKIIPKEKDSLYFQHLCKFNGKYTLQKISMITKLKRIISKDIFYKTTKRQFITFSKDSIKSIISLNPEISLLFFPYTLRRSLDVYIKKTLIMPNKYGVNKDGNLSIYLP